MAPGKPVAETFARVSSISTCLLSGACLYAITREREIGVDIEHVRPIPEAEQIADRFFSARENTVLRAASEPEAQGVFNCWTQEA